MKLEDIKTLEDAIEYNLPMFCIHKISNKMVKTTNVLKPFMNL